MSATRGEVTVETLAKVALALVIVWIALEIVQTLLGLIGGIVRGAFTLLGPLLAIVLIVILGFWALEAFGGQ